MGVLRFDAMRVGQLMAHAKAAPDHMPYPEFRGGDGSKLPRVIFVHDNGIYLMSSGQPRADGEALVYAKGYEWTYGAKHGSPADQRNMEVWDRARDAVGGDDFAEYFEVAELEPIPEDAVWFTLRVSPTKIAAGWESAAPRRRARS